MSSLQTGSSPFVIWKNEFLPFPKKAVAQNVFTLLKDFLSDLLGLEVALTASWGIQFSGEKFLLCTLAAFTLGALSLGGF